MMFITKKINKVREKFSTVKEEVNKKLIELHDIYNSNNNMERVESITNNMEKLNEEYSNTDLWKVSIEEPQEEMDNQSSQYNLNDHRRKTKLD